jgi:hypothetical protein
MPFSALQAWSMIVLERKHPDRPQDEAVPVLPVRHRASLHAQPLTVSAGASTYGRTSYQLHYPAAYP